MSEKPNQRQESGRPRPAAIFTRENLLAVALCLILLLLIIVTSDAAPQWIYQGF